MQYLYNVPGRHKFLFIITILLVLAGKQKREVLRRIEESHLKIELNRLEKELFYLEKDLVLEPKLYESEHNILPEKHIEETIRPENPDIELIITNPKTTNQQNLTNRLIFRPTKPVILMEPSITEFDILKKISQKSEDIISNQLPIEKALKNLSTTSSCPSPAPLNHPTTPTHNTNSDSFLFPILKWGPTNQVDGLFESIKLAVITNRTLVLPPMYVHFTDHRTVASEASSNNTCSTCIDPSVRVNTQEIVKFVRSVTPEVYYARWEKTLENHKHFRPLCYEKCGRKADILIVPAGNSWLQGGSTKSFQEFTKMNFVKLVTEKKMRVVSDLKAEGRCAVFSRPFRTVKYPIKPGIPENAFDIPFYVYQMVESVTRQLRSDASYFDFAVHWRYTETDWDRRCQYGRPSTIAECEIMHYSNPETIAKAFINYFEEKVTVGPTDHVYIYLASPPDAYEFLKNTIKALKILNPRYMVFYGPDLIELFNSKFKHCKFYQANTGEVLSLVDQAISVQSKNFIGWAASSWTARVANLRTIHVGRKRPGDYHIMEILKPIGKFLHEQAKRFQEEYPNYNGTLMDGVKISNSRKLDEYKVLKEPPNRKLYFHNKMPKCGSTVMQTLLKRLEKKNGFKLHNLYDPGSKNENGLIFDAMKAEDDENLKKRDSQIKYSENQETETQESKTQVILKHHSFVDFQKHNLTQPTFFNVIRSPVDRFASEYYFCRNGWEKNPTYKGSGCSKMNETDLKQSLNECVSSKNPLCIAPNFVYIQWLCGGDNKLCNFNKFDVSGKRRALEFTKNLILNEYFTIGLLEDLDTSLRLFERIMPDVFGGVVDVFMNDEKVKDTIMSTKTRNRGKVSDEIRVVMEKTVFNYEMDLFNLVQYKFYQQVKMFLFN